MPHQAAPHAPATVRAWDLPTRIFHWLLPALLLAAWATYEFSEPMGDTTLVWHRVCGLAILILLVWRLLWGLTGSSTARFASFVRGPAAIATYTRSLFGGNASPYLGHNPLGALMVLALLTALILQAGFGLFATDDNDLIGGPLYRLVGEAANVRAARLHGQLFDFVLLPLAALHIAVNLTYTFAKREPLIQAMVTGKKPAAIYADATEAVVAQRPLLRALVVLGVAAVIVLGGIVALGGTLKL